MNSLIFIIFAIVAINGQLAWRIGSSSNTILPRVNGRTDYVIPRPESDFSSPGTFVQKFDDGIIAIGNGASNARWVRDEVNCSCVAIATSGQQTLIVTSANVYMIFKQDWTLIENMVRDKVGSRFGSLKFINHATHNHHMADTSGLDPRNVFNDKWFTYLMSQIAKTMIESLESMKPATLHVSSADWAFGLADARDPRILDKRLRVLQAKSSVGSGRVISTIVQWSNHPEVTLGFVPTVSQIDCERVGVPNCSAKDSYMSGDFVSVMERHVKTITGGNVIYLNGALGIMQSPIPARVWEPSERFPIIGDGSVFPDGAERVPTSFRKTFLIGRELGKAVIRITASFTTLVPPFEFQHRSVEFFSRVTNIRFRIAMRTTRGTRSQIGFAPREIYICSDHQNPTPNTCVSDQFRNTVVYDLPVRLGEYIKTEISMVDFGSMNWVTNPGEMPPELFIGLPNDFGVKYYQTPQYHAVGENYTLPGVVSQILKCNSPVSCWMIGLGGDELGYVVPLSDIRFKCILGATVCAQLPLTYDDSMSGSECKWIIENEDDAKKKYKQNYPAMHRICILGHLEKAQNHYEETNGLGWNFASDYMKSLELLSRK